MLGPSDGLVTLVVLAKMREEGPSVR
ncbi:hypothetical protein IEO21_10302 [Rhodonia placenta]|uniref:Uncharacterized protein n=1 Tax=Rhodonia placenta TaxID=104341 RepID=A0A8H7TXF7_9APHY|nr:hypothetical protein IEO21_10302 [Postia placenta]